MPRSLREFWFANCPEPAMNAGPSNHRDSSALTVLTQNESLHRVVGIDLQGTSLFTFTPVLPCAACDASLGCSPQSPTHPRLLSRVASRVTTSSQSGYHEIHPTCEARVIGISSAAGGATRSHFVLEHPRVPVRSIPNPETRD